MQGQTMALQHKFAWRCLGMQCSSHAQQSNIVPSAMYSPEHPWLTPSSAFGTPAYTAWCLGTQGQEGAGPEQQQHTAASGQKTTVLPQNWSRASQSENLINYNAKH